MRGILRRRPQAVSVRLFEAALERQFTLVTSEYILNEVKEALVSPEVRRLAPLPQALIEAVLEALRAAAYVVEGTWTVNVVPRDPKDNPIVACALEGNAGYIVTDDRAHLLPLKVVRVGSRRVQVVTPMDFLTHHLA